MWWSVRGYGNATENEDGAGGANEGPAATGDLRPPATASTPQGSQHAHAPRDFHLKSVDQGCGKIFCRLGFRLMSTLALEKLPESVETLSALIHEGKSVRLTEKGRVVAEVKPAAVRDRKGQKATVIEILREIRPHRRPRPDRDFTAFLRAERDRA